MKKLFVLFFLSLAFFADAQLLNTTPNFVLETSNSITITADATKGNKALLNFTGDVFVHLGLITSVSANSSAWQYVPSFSVWTGTDPRIKATSLGNNQWSFTITGGLRSYFGVTNGSEKIYKIAILFRNSAGTKLANEDGSDMYVNIYDNQFYAKIDTPLSQPLYVPQFETIKKTLGDTLFVNAKSSENATLSFYFNDTLLKTATNTSSLSAFKKINKTGTQKLLVIGNNGTTTSKDSLSFLVYGEMNLQDVPAGMVDGVNYHAGDTSVTLVLYAPKKTNVSVIGDFNNWTASLPYVMNLSKDTTRFWLKINGLTPGVEYAYQYVIDDNIKVADYNTEKVLDPNNDSYIPAATYPNLKAYPTG